MRVSVIIPVYNGERFLAEALRSVLEQEYRPFEVIVVDDGSTDASAAIVRGFAAEKLCYCYQARSGPAAARNRGLELARGGCIAFLDADDLWTPESLACRASRFMKEPALEVLLGGVLQVGESGEPIGEAAPASFYLGSALFRRSAFARVGVFNAALGCSEDVDWFLRAREAGLPMLAIGAIVLLRRHHGANMTRGRNASELGLMRVLKDSLRRRRRRGPASPLATIPRESGRGDAQDAPLVSVILPVYNGDRFLAECIQSVSAQSYRPLEIIAVDDGSTDGSVATLRASTGVRLFRRPHRGVAAARNHGIHQSAGELIAFIDQDDRWTPGKLSAQVRCLQEHPELGYVLGRQRMFLDPGEKKPAWVREAWLREDEPGYLPGTLVVRRRIFEIVGLFDASFESGSDSDWFFRARDAGIGMRILPELLLERRIHALNQSRHTGAGAADLLRVARRSVERKRRHEREAIAS